MYMFLYIHIYVHMNWWFTLENIGPYVWVKRILQETNLWMTRPSGTISQAPFEDDQWHNILMNKSVPLFKIC